MISTARLERYGNLHDLHMAETLARYRWNTVLCEELYTVLNTFEVALRNRIQHTLANQTGLQRWWDPKRALLSKQDEKNIERLMSRLRKEGKNPNVGRVVSSLTLGFWVGMFAAEYEQRFWKGKALRSVFPYAPRQDLAYPELRRK